MQTMMKLIALVALFVFAGCTKNIPPPAVKISADEALVARGAYLSNHVMSCVVCHSKRDWSKLGGPVIAGTEHGGSDDIAREDHFPESFSFSAPNLTPYRMKTWTDEEFAKATALGQSKDGSGLFPLMPYRVWRDALALDDLSAVIAYLRTLQPIKHDDIPRKFPIPGFVMNGFPEERTLRAKAPTPSDADYPQYVLAVAGCIECHTNTDNRGKRIGEAYAGGREFKVPSPGGGVVRSTNITPDDETGIGKWTKEIFVQRFKSATPDAAQPIENGGYNTIMPWWSYSGMSEEDLGALYEALRKIPPVKNVVVRHSPKESAAP